jgi:hypothetical protein
MLVNGFMSVVIVANCFLLKKETAVFFVLMEQWLVRQCNKMELVVHNMSPEKFFRALADETRLRCVVLIQQEGELCVCE